MFNRAFGKPSRINAECRVVESHVNLSTFADAVVETESSPQLFKVSRERPWVIPGESHFSSVLKTSNEQIGGTLVQAKTFQCSGELPQADVDFYYMRGDGQLYVRTSLLALQHLSSYSLDGRTFAYRAAFVKVDARSDGKREYVGAVFILHYYDEDGDGKFETRYGDLMSLKAPDWYKGK
jgi:hypothetical protein